MTDVVREIDIVSFPLRFAMIADRAEVALIRYEQGGPLQERDKKALKNARAFMTEAQEGLQILERNTMQGYSSEALSAYELSERASEQAKIKKKGFRAEYEAKLGLLLQETQVQTEPVAALRKFFHELAEWCLAQDVGEVEGVFMDNLSYESA